jgi:hypothetical protein
VQLAGDNSIRFDTSITGGEERPHVEDEGFGDFGR